MTKIAIQGSRGSFHELGASQYFNGSGLQIHPCTTFDSAINAVVKQEANLALIAIDNVWSGSILDNYSLILEKNCNSFEILGFYQKGNKLYESTNS